MLHIYMYKYVCIHTHEGVASVLRISGDPCVGGQFVICSTLSVGVAEAGGLKAAQSTFASAIALLAHSRKRE